MKFMVLIYSNPTTWKHPLFQQQAGLTEAERAQLTDEFDKLLAEINASGAMSRNCRC